MGQFNFDEMIDRRNTGSIKYDFSMSKGLPDDALSLWVADMDFRTSPAITDALVKMAEYGVFGYTEAEDAYFEAVSNWYEQHFNWKSEKEWIITTPGVVFALAHAVRAYTKPGDAVLIQPPVYYPFSSVIRNNDRRIVHNPLVCRDGHYEMDFEDFEEKIRTEKVKMFILCSPHNPAGRVWKRAELERIVEICSKYGVTVISDEIHSDFVWDDNVHTVFASVSPEAQKMCVICTAPSKSFNLAGVQASNIFIPDREKREAFKAELDRSGYDMMSMPALVAARAAYEKGGPWLDEVRAYIRENIRFIEDYIREEIPGIGVVHPEGTYLVWIDLGSLKMTPEQQDEFIRKEAGLWLDTGSIFGEEGSSFERLNAACPRQIVEEAMERLKKAVLKIRQK